MRTRLLFFAVLVALSSAAIVSGDESDARSPGAILYDRETGELSPGTSAPSRSAMVQAIDRSSPTRLVSTLEYGERVECHECVPLLEAKLLEAGDPRVREIAAWWLRRRPFAVGAIAKRMKDVLAGDTDAVRRARAAEALGELLDAKLFDPLATALSADTDPGVRSAAVRGIARLNVSRSGAAVAQALADDDAEVRRAAADSLAGLSFFSDSAAVVARLADEDSVVRRKAARFIGERRVIAGTTALVPLLDDEDAVVRQAAAYALGRIGGGEARAALTRAAEDETVSITRDAIAVALRM